MHPPLQFGIIIPMAPFGMPEYDGGERFDLRVRLKLLWITAQQLPGLAAAWQNGGRLLEYALRAAWEGLLHTPRPQRSGVCGCHMHWCSCLWSLTTCGCRAPLASPSSLFLAPQLPFVDKGDPDPELDNDPLGLKQLGKALGLGKKK
jgi:hypothetical protein